jgi:ABC-type phosphate/phosphonate transport system substrate-binding protein
MYDWPEVRWAHDALWVAIAARLKAAGIAAPDRLDRARPCEEVWHDPGLVLSQTCGYPFSTRLMQHVRLVLTPAYDVEGCDHGFYSSLIVVRHGEGDALSAFAGRRFAVNARDSLSGYVALVQAMRRADLGDADADWIETGSHRASIRAVARGTADIAAIDAVCWALAGDFEPEAVARLDVIARTPLRPGLPLVTAASADPARLEQLRGAILNSLAAPETAAARRALRIDGAAVLNHGDYAPLARLLA